MFKDTEFPTMYSDDRWNAHAIARFFFEICMYLALVGVIALDTNESSHQEVSG